MEAEAHGEGETLARHERLLLDLAKRYNYNVTQIYREIVSGETIAARPVVQQLLREVEQGMWDGVLVAEVERLARGDTIDQGKVSLAFQSSGTLIITPLKVYDPTNEFDQEYFEFGLFMSRREYKTINRRLQRGRIASVKEGKYVSARAPYGYERIHVPNDKGYTLRPVESEAAVVRYIFNTYAYGEPQSDGSLRPVGVWSICKSLDAAGVAPPTSASSYWQAPTISAMLRNPVYIGKILWHACTIKKVVTDGSVSRVRVPTPPDQQILVDGLHPPLISEDVFYKVQDILAHNRVPSVHRSSELKNPLAGILYCGKCGSAMARHPVTPPVLCCSNKKCDNVSSRANVVEERLLQALSDWLAGYRLEWSADSVPDEQPSIDFKHKAIAKAERDIKTLEQQLSRTHDLLEQGVYDTDTFLARCRSINDRTLAAKKTIEELTASLAVDEQRAAARSEIIPKVEHVLDVYNSLPNAQAKNTLLKDVVERIEYVKYERGTRGGGQDNFELTIYPKLPQK